MIIALTLVGALLANTATGGETLTGKMAIYTDLLGPRWTCTMGNGHLYSEDGTEDTYFGYDGQRKLYWTDNADSTGATESQKSADGVTFDGTLNDGSTTSKATNIFTISSAHKWAVRARGFAAGHPYDVTATCRRN